MPVFVAYAHDERGRALARALVSALRSRKVSVVWDRDLKEQNVPSQAAWMSTAIAENVVICVLSEAFVEHFGRSSDSSVHRGVRFESFLIIQKFYDHVRSTHCPIIPLADEEFAAESAPGLLAGIPISRLGADPGPGLEEIIQRIRVIEDAPPDAVTQPRKLPEIVDDLESTGTTEVSGPDLVREWLRCLITTPVDAGEFVGTLPAVENVLRGAVDDQLVREVTDRCVAALNVMPAGSLGPDEKARALIVGLAWFLRRRREFGLAAKVVHEAVEVAEVAGDHSTAALGYACLGHIYRELAEDTAGRQRAVLLRSAEENVKNAVELLRRHGDRIGACHHVRAHIRWTRYQLLGDVLSLMMADRLAEKAARQLSAADLPMHHEMLLLRAEIAVSRGELQRAGELVDRVVWTLTTHPGCSIASSGMAGRAHLVSAEIYRHAAPAKATRHAEAALKLFDRAQMSRFADSSRWVLVTLDPGSSGLQPADVRYLERHCQEPDVLLQAVAERRRRVDDHVRRRRTMRAEWRDILKAVDRAGCSRAT
ncbi:hypothetical protein AB0F52_47525 [Amycolatopsis sp. NPDC024027]|uniref:hypothetical protein n=1 Tax=Amycolatopsis sp. NPDC024027 TaxID=3154327 RepID=UPI0033EF5711